MHTCNRKNIGAKTQTTGQMYLILSFSYFTKQTKPTNASPATMQNTEDDAQKGFMYKKSLTVYKSTLCKDYENYCQFCASHIILYQF